MNANVVRPQHPLYDPNGITLRTAPTDQLVEVLHRWMWTGATGGLVFGQARLGKTRALQQIQHSLNTRDGTVIPALYFSVAQRDTNSIAAIYRLLCNSIKLTHTQKDRADYLADAVVYYLIDSADKAGCNSVVLYVDEMQRLNIKQMNIFAELYDRLKLLNIHLMTVFIGNDPQCFELVELAQEDGFAHIKGRFFTQFHQFHGLRSATEVCYCLEQYDKSRYPQDGPTYTEYFLPDAVSDGFKLAGLSTKLWQYFREYAKPHGITSWGMQYFTAAVNCLLLDFLPNYGVEAFSQDMVNAALEVSGTVTSRVEVRS